MNLESYINNHELFYYKNLLKADIDSETKESIKKKIKKLIESINITNDSIVEEKNSELETKLSETEEGYFYKPWNKMTTVHKIIKMKEFVNNMDVNNEMKNKLITYLKIALKDKKITKNDQVIYNVNQAKIISIPKLKLDNNGFSISQ